MRRIKIKNILFITLSNLGDVVLTLPVLDLLKFNFPESKISVMTDERSKDIFKLDVRINKLIIYDKFSPLREKIRLAISLKKDKYDLIVDLKNTAFGLILSPKYRTPITDSFYKDIHAKEKHLQKLRKIPLKNYSVPRTSLNIRWEDRMYINGLLNLEGVTLEDKIVVVSPGARTHIKRWEKEGFSRVSDKLIEEMRLKVIFVGDEKDSEIIEEIIKGMHNRPINLCGKTSVGQLCALLKRSQVLISNDSAVMHIGSYLNIPIIALFGPTDKNRYRPWSDKNIVIQKELFCAPCSKAECRFSFLPKADQPRAGECMKLIEPEEVFKATKELLNV